jgi:hypothetical protein
MGWRRRGAKKPRLHILTVTFFLPDFTLPGHILPELFVPYPPPGHPPPITFFFPSLFSALGLLGGDDSRLGRLQEESPKKKKSQIIYLVTYRV